MVRAFRKNNTLMPLWAVGVADGTTKATKSVTFTGTATAAGVVALYVGGQNLNIAVASGDTAADIAQAIESAVTDNMPVTASASSGTVTFTAKNGGTAGNYIDIRVNYVAGEVLPDGISVSGTGLVLPRLIKSPYKMYGMESAFLSSCRLVLRFSHGSW